jgi:hypothetical protein
MVGVIRRRFLATASGGANYRYLLIPKTRLMYPQTRGVMDKPDKLASGRLFMQPIARCTHPVASRE